MIARIRTLRSERPRVIDALVALFWMAFSFLNDVVASDDSVTVSVVVPAVIVCGLVLYERRRHPVAVFGVQAAVVTLLTIIDVDGDLPISILAGVYSMAAWGTDRRRSIQMLAAFVIIAVPLVWITDAEYFDDAIVVALVLALAWLIGDAVRNRRLRRAALIERAERAEALRDSLAQQAVIEERARIARELHDVVAHSMSLMVVQAGAARRIVDHDPERAVEALSAIEQVGRKSLDEMRRIVDVLRADDDGAETTPQPGLDALQTLAEEFAAAGLAVELTHDGIPAELSAGLELAVYRIIQESLTNALKHSGAERASVELSWSSTQLNIMIEDAGAGTVAEPVGGSGKGLIGMRERVAAFDGTFSASPRLGGGWRVTATLPLDPIEHEVAT